MWNKHDLGGREVGRLEREGECFDLGQEAPVNGEQLQNGFNKHSIFSDHVL